MNCHSCNKYLSCKRGARASGAGCSQFIPIKDYSRDLVGELFQNLELEDGIHVPSRSIVIPDRDGEEESLLDIVSSILDAKGGSGIVPPDIRIDDQACREYSSFYEWSVDPQGSGATPFARQLWIGSWLFAEMCPYCSASPDWATDILAVPIGADLHEMGERIQFLEHGLCPSCGRTKTDLYSARKLDPLQELCLVVGQRAGKSITVSFLLAYHLHRMLKLQKPTQVYGLPNNQTLTATVVGLTFSTAIRLLWGPLKDLIATSPWFQQYHALLDDYGQRYGEELYKEGELLLHYKHRQLLLNPQGADKRKLRGESRFASAIDELGWWPLGSNQQEDEAMEKSGSEVYGALDRSLLTIRNAARNLWKQGYYNVPTAYSFNVSSPSSSMDMIMRLYRTSQHSRKMFGLQLPTWEINPAYTRKSFDDDYLKDPVKAERDYGANPPVAANAFIGGSTTVDDSFCLPDSKIRFENLWRTVGDQLKQGVKLVHNYVSGRDIRPSVLAIDAGITKNSFAIVIGQTVPAKNPKELPTYEFPVVLEVIPQNGAHLSHNQIFKHLVIPLMIQLNVCAVVADRWNSKLLLDSVEEELGKFSQQYSVKMADFNSFKSYLEGGKIKLPKLTTTPADAMDFDPEQYPQCFDMQPVDHLYLQMHTVVDNGRTVDKGLGLTDDTFRAMVLCFHFLTDPDFVATYLKNVQKRGPVALGVVGVLSGGGGGGSIDSRIGAIGSMSRG